METDQDKKVLLKNKLLAIVKDGFIHLFGSQILVKIVSMVSGLLVSRFLSKADYGVYTYVDNALNTVMLVNGLGVASAFLQLGSENQDDPLRKNAFLRLSYRVAWIFDLFVAVVMLVIGFTFVWPIEGAGPYIALISATPFLIITVDLFAVKLRVDLENRLFSLYNLWLTVLLAVASIVGALISLRSVFVLRYVAYLAMVVLTIIFFRRFMPRKESTGTLDRADRSIFFKLALVSCASNGISQMLMVIDQWLIGQILQDKEILAAYRVSTMIPFTLVFIPATVMIYAYPHFAKRRHDKAWLRKNYKFLFWGMFALNALIAAVLIVAAPLIIRLLFPKYPESVPIFRVLSAGFFITATFRIPSANILIMMRQIKFDLVMSIVSGILNVILDVWFINMWGSMGAAVATVSIYTFAGLLNTIYLRRLLNRPSDLAED